MLLFLDSFDHWSRGYYALTHPHPHVQDFGVYNYGPYSEGLADYTWGQESDYWEYRCDGYSHAQAYDIVYNGKSYSRTDQDETLVRSVALSLREKWLHGWPGQNGGQYPFGASARAARRGGYGLDGSQFHTTVKLGVVTPSPTVVVGFAVKVLSRARAGAFGLQDTVPNCTLVDVSRTYHREDAAPGNLWWELGQQIRCHLNTDRTISVLSSQNLLWTDQELVRTTRALDFDRWHYFEFKATLARTGGSALIHVDGKRWASFTGATQGQDSTEWSHVTIGQNVTYYADTSATYIDDFYLLDGRGPAPWNTILGPSRVDVYLPNANGTDRDWARSAGADDYALVDDPIGPPYDTTITDPLPVSTDDFIATSTVGAATSVRKDAYRLSGGAIRSVQAAAYIRKTAYGPCSVRLYLRIGGVRYESADVFYPCVDEWTYVFARWDACPATGQAWQEADFADTEVGILRVGLQTAQLTPTGSLAFASVAPAVVKSRSQFSDPLPTPGVCASVLTGRAPTLRKELFLSPDTAALVATGELPERVVA